MTAKSRQGEFLEEMAKVSRKIRTLFDARVREHGLTLARARTLLRIAHGEALNQKELAEELEIESATLVRLIDGLETQGLIRRCEVDGDRRAKQVVLTQEGAALATLVDGMVARIARDALAGIAECDVEATLVLTKKMARNIETAAIARAK